MHLQKWELPADEEEEAGSNPVSAFSASGELALEDRFCRQLVMEDSDDEESHGEASKVLDFLRENRKQFFDSHKEREHVTGGGRANKKNYASLLKSPLRSPGAGSPGPGGLSLPLSSPTSKSKSPSKRSKGLLSEHERFDVSSLDQVEFDAGNALNLSFGGKELPIIFPDDMGRETWRHGLNYVLQGREWGQGYTDFD